MFWRIMHLLLLLLVLSRGSSLTDQLSAWVTCSALVLLFYNTVTDPGLPSTSGVVKAITDVSCADLIRYFLHYPQLVFATALIKLIFLSAFRTVSSTCGLNDSDLSNVTPRELWVQLTCSIFSPILMESFQSNSELGSVKKVDSLFVLLKFNFHFLLKLSTAITAFCRDFRTWVSELAVAKIKTLSAYIAFLLLQYWWDLFGDVYQLYCEVCWYTGQIEVFASTEPCGSPRWILWLCLILLLKWTCACCFSRNEDSHSTY